MKNKEYHPHDFLEYKLALHIRIIFSPQAATITIAPTFEEKHKKMSSMI